MGAIFSRKWLRALILALLTVVAGWLLYPRLENRMVFFPDRALETTPSQMGMIAEDVFFQAADQTRLHGWFFPSRPGAPVVLFSHGNAGNISHRIPDARHLTDHGLQVFLYDYRGYGKSEGEPSEEGIYQDGLAAYDWLVVQKGIPPGLVVSFGRSLGAAVAIEIAARRKVTALIVEGAFTNTREMAGKMPIFQILAPLLPAHYNNIEKIRGIYVPKLIIHGEADEVVPFAMGQALYRAAPEPKSHYWIPRARHNDTTEVAGEEYGDRFLKFVLESIR